MSEIIPYLVPLKNCSTNLHFYTPIYFFPNTVDLYILLNSEKFTTCFVTKPIWLFSLDITLSIRVTFSFKQQGLFKITQKNWNSMVRKSLENMSWYLHRHFVVSCPVESHASKGSAPIEAWLRRTAGLWNFSNREQWEVMLTKLPTFKLIENRSVRHKVLSWQKLHYLIRWSANFLVTVAKSRPPPFGLWSGWILNLCKWRGLFW